jgi:hypothetical protein
MPRITARELTYGIEIECGINADAPVRVGGYRHGTAVTRLPSFNGLRWKAERDGSVHVDGKKTAEFISPILKGAEGLDNIRAACAQIKAWGGETNRTCGLHIHIAFPSTHIADMRRLTQLVGRFEEALYVCTGTPDRRNSQYCRPIKTDAVKNMNWGGAYSKRCISDMGRFNSRYHTLNWTNFLTNRFDAVEFRVFSGSLNPAKIAAWVQICLTLVEAALDETEADWDISETSIASEINRSCGSRGVALARYMCKYLWQWPIRKDKNYGELGHAHFTRKAAAKTLRDLAVRHDERIGAREARRTERLSIEG